MGLAACAGHYEKIGDTATAQVALDEWLALNPNYYTSQLAKGRVCLFDKKFDLAEKHFKSALGSAANLCPRAVDSTVTQRKLGPRMGLGKVFPGIFPREVETYCHLLILYAITDRQEDAERLMSYLAGIGQDVLFISIVSMIAEPNIDQILGAKYLARYVEVVISTEPIVWAGERIRHLAHFWMLRGQALIALNNREEGINCLKYALTQSPYPNVETQIKAALAHVR
jgi:tetratricopeptide (TPR) repeat protein